MRDISNKINDSAPASSGYLDASQFNSTQTELENATVAAPGGLSLDADGGPDSSLYMLAQSITRHSAGGAIYCTATGSPSAHIVSMADANVRPPTALFLGLTCRYDPPAANASSAVTVNAFGHGAKALVNHVGAPLSSTEIDGRVIDIYYDPSIGSGSWVLPAWSNALYVGQTPSSPQSVSSGEGVEVDGSNLVNLNFSGLTGDANPDDADLFAFKDVSEGAHNSITKAQLAALLGAGGGIVGMQLITASGTYTKTAGTNKAIAFATGGGGGGGGNTTSNTASGGGAGATAISFVDLSAVSTVACTIGAGGTGGVANGGSGGAGGSTSFGSHATAGGGSPGTGTAGSNGGRDAAGGLGGTASVGLVKLAGNPGINSLYLNGGTGGGSFWGGGGRGGAHGDLYGAPTSGGAGLSYGAGGGGGDGPPSAGGAGASGCILVIEFA